VEPLILQEVHTFIGSQAGEDNISGSSNTFIGASSGTENTGDSNTFIGSFSGISNTAGESNTFIGGSSGFNNTTGGTNTFLGIASGVLNTTGFSNTFIGANSGQNNLGANNTFLGGFSGSSNTSGINNVFLGLNAGFDNEFGGNNIIIGAFSNTNSIGLNNAIAIGSSTIVDANNKVVIGNSGMTVIGGAVNWSTLSDARYKQNIKKSNGNLDFILALEPVSYNMNTKKQFDESAQQLKNIYDKKQQTAKSLARNSTYQVTDNSRQEIEMLHKNLAQMKVAAENKAKIKYNGFLAQAVEKAVEKTGYSFSGLVKPTNDKEKYALRYAEFVVPLVGAVQELKAEKDEAINSLNKVIHQQAEQLTQQQAQIQELSDLVKTLVDHKTVTDKVAVHQLTLGQSAFLAQNYPNPFKGQTTLNYFVPENVQQAVIQITAQSGAVLGKVNIGAKGQGQVVLETAGLQSGKYYYSLLLDGQVFETKQMVLTQ